MSVRAPFLVQSSSLRLMHCSRTLTACASIARRSLRMSESGYTLTSSRWMSEQRRAELSSDLKSAGTMAFGGDNQSKQQ